ncbi:hypothetical protein FNF31_01218 [Cafeteria roenbergensis]|nr:hypothetical protein FNF28_05106 [Cafeteria roenbergensis]KAA0166843.1 hypothetical protein FNF31_01218 [Cafeteria roenbergensis]
MIADLSLLSRADGSAKLACGETSVVAGVFGPMPSRSSRLEDPTKMVIEVTVRPMAGQASRVEKALERRILGVLERAVDVAAHPRALVRVAVQVCGNGGGLAAAALNACTLALLDAAVPLQYCPHACDVAVLPAARPSEAAAGSGAAGASPKLSSGSATRLVIDPTEEEEAAARACFSAVFVPADAPQARGLATSTARAASLRIAGSTSREEAEGAVALAEAGAAAAGAFLSLAMRRRTAQDAERRGVVLQG